MFCWLSLGWSFGFYGFRIFRKHHDGPPVVVGTGLGIDLGTTNRGTQTNKPRVSPTVPLCSPPDSPSDDLCAHLTPSPMQPTGSPLHDLRDPQRKPEDSRDKDGREKGGKEKGPEGDGKRHTGHRRVLPNDKPPRCRGEQPRGSIERFDQSGSLDQFFLLVRVN